MTTHKPTYVHPDGEHIEINAGRVSATFRVTNNGDRPVQVGSHFHFFEVNRALYFDREQAYGRHLDIPAGSGVRFEPGETKEVTVVDFNGARRLYGFNDLVNGGLDAEQTKIRALRKMEEEGFGHGVDHRKVGVVSPFSAADKKRKEDNEKRAERRREQKEGK